MDRAAPEEIELNKKLRVLDRLKDRLADREEEMADIRADLAPLLAPHELPRSVNVVTALPRTAGGKIDRRAMRTLAASEE